MRLVALAFAATLLSSAAAFAQECDRSDESQQGMNICAAEDYQTADADLNKAYKAAMARLSDNAEGRKLLQSAQRAWIAFRDAECDFSTNGSKDGSIYPQIYSDCLTGLTEARAEQIEGYLACEEGDLACPLPPN